jgi:hypothetical protein
MLNVCVTPGCYTRTSGSSDGLVGPSIQVLGPPPKRVQPDRGEFQPFPMRVGLRRAIHPEVSSPEPISACRPPSPAYLSNNKNQDKSGPPKLLASLNFTVVSLNPSDSSSSSATPKDRLSQPPITLYEGGPQHKAPEQGKDWTDGAGGMSEGSARR